MQVVYLNFFKTLRTSCKTKATDKVKQAPVLNLHLVFHKYVCLYLFYIVMAKSMDHRYEIR